MIAYLIKCKSIAKGQRNISRCHQPIIVWNHANRAASGDSRGWPSRAKARGGAGPTAKLDYKYSKPEGEYRVNMIRIESERYRMI
jgi:hypothetical protein